MVLEPLRELQEDREVGPFGYAVAPGIDLQAPLDPVDLLGLRVDDRIAQLVVVAQDIGEAVVLWEQFVAKS